MADVAPDAPGVIRERLVSVSWVDEAFYCGRLLAAGCDMAGVVTVVCEACVADSALAHELMHVYLDGDPEHRSPLWLAVPKINSKLRLLICR